MSKEIDIKNCAGETIGFAGGSGFDYGKVNPSIDSAARDAQGYLLSRPEMQRDFKTGTKVSDAGMTPMGIFVGDESFGEVIRKAKPEVILTEGETIQPKRIQPGSLGY